MALDSITRKKILVTGGAGFIGAQTTNELIKMGHKVVVLDDLSGGFKANVNKDAFFIKADILDYKLLEKLFKRHRFDYVFHMAAYAAEGLSHFIKRFNYMNNVVGSVNIINECIKNKVKCLVFTSSIAVYGRGRLPLKEDMQFAPEDPYGIAKMAVENELRVSHDLFGLNFIIFRPHNVYGEYQNIGDRYRNVVGIFMRQAIKKKPLTVFGNGEQTRAFSYIGDIAPHIANSINIKNAYNEVFNVGGDHIYTVKNLAQKILEVTGMVLKINYLKKRHEVEHAYSDHTKFNRIFGKGKTTLLENGLEKMWKWARKTGVPKIKKFKDIEIKEKLPPSWAKR